MRFGANNVDHGCENVAGECAPDGMKLDEVLEVLEVLLDGLSLRPLGWNSSAVNVVIRRRAVRVIV